MRMLGREWKSGELGVLLLALTVAVAALTGVGFLVNRISQSVEMQATEVLAADLRLESPNPLPEDFAASAERQGLSVARTTAVHSLLSSIWKRPFVTGVPPAGDTVVQRMCPSVTVASSSTVSRTFRIPVKGCPSTSSVPE